MPDGQLNSLDQGVLRSPSKDDLATRIEVLKKDHRVSSVGHEIGMGYVIFTRERMGEGEAKEMVGDLGLRVDDPTKVNGKGFCFRSPDVGRIVVYYSGNVPIQ